MRDSSHLNHTYHLFFIMWYEISLLLMFLTHSLIDLTIIAVAFIFLHFVEILNCLGLFSVLSGSCPWLFLDGILDHWSWSCASELVSCIWALLRLIDFHLSMLLLLHSVVETLLWKGQLEQIFPGILFVNVIWLVSSVYSDLIFYFLPFFFFLLLLKVLEC